MITRTYEPPLSKGRFPFHWDPRTQLAPGVRGFAYRRGDEIIIPLIVAEVEASGDVGRFLDSLSSRCVIQSLTSDRLHGMLVRRGFKKRKVNGVDEWKRL